MGNSRLSAAKKAKNDEFYTRYGVTEYILGGETERRPLNVRVFDKRTTKAVHRRRTDAAKAAGVSNRPMRAASGQPNLEKRIYRESEMDADRVTAWSRGGATDESNRRMPCKTRNRSKGNRWNPCGRPGALAPPLPRPERVRRMAAEPSAVASRHGDPGQRHAPAHSLPETDKEAGIMATDAKGNNHKAAGRPDGGRFDRKAGQGSDDDLDFDAMDGRLSRAMPSLDHEARRRIIDAVRNRPVEGGATGGPDAHPTMDGVEGMMSDLRADMAAEGARAVSERRVLPYDTVMQVGEYGDFITVDDYRRRLPTRLDRARYEAWENSPGGDDDYDARLLKAWNDPDALESLSADSPLWDMDVNDGAYETEMELDWEDDCGYGCDPIRSLADGRLEKEDPYSLSPTAADIRTFAYGPLKDFLRARPDVGMDASPDGGVILRSGGRDARVSFGVQGDVTVDGVGHYAITEYGSTKAAAEAAMRDTAAMLAPDGR